MMIDICASAGHIYCGIGNLIPLVASLNRSRTFLEISHNFLAKQEVTNISHNMLWTNSLELRHSDGINPKAIKF